MNWAHNQIKNPSLIYGFLFLNHFNIFQTVDEPPLDKTGHVKDPGQEDGAAVGEHGEDEMDMESEKEEEKPRAGGGAFSNALSSLNVLRPGVSSPAARVGARKARSEEGRATWWFLQCPGVKPGFPSASLKEWEN